MDTSMTALEAEEFILSRSPGRYTRTKPATPRRTLAGFTYSDGRELTVEMKLSPPRIWLEDGDWLSENLKTLFPEGAKFYEEGAPRQSNIKRINGDKAMVKITVPTLDLLAKLLVAYEGANRREPGPGLGSLAEKSRDGPSNQEALSLLNQPPRPAPDPGSLAAWNERFDASVRDAQQRSEEERRKRLETAPRFPRRSEVTVTVFDRNPYVVAEVLSRANGICEECVKPAPFLRRSNRTPYLEVHHRVPLAIGGEDTVGNAVALCPNCHRGAHYA